LGNSAASIRDTLWRAIPLVLCVSILVSCSQSKTLTAEDMKSELASAVSLASETQMFVEQWQTDRLTGSFIKTHLDYLRQEARSSIKQLDESRVEPSIAAKSEICRTQLKALHHELLVLQTDADSHVRPLRMDCQRIEQIRKSLEDTKSTP
jgi:transposase-like protein